MYYVTGTTALNLPIKGRTQALWHTLSALKPESLRAWRIAGLNYSSTEHILGLVQVYDIQGLLSQFGITTSPSHYAAGYERAVFDTVYHHAIHHSRVVNVQKSDIDDVVDFKLVIQWTKDCRKKGLLTSETSETMLSWLDNSTDWLSPDL